VGRCGRPVRSTIGTTVSCLFVAIGRAGFEAAAIGSVVTPLGLLPPFCKKGPLASFAFPWLCGPFRFEGAGCVFMV